MKKSLLSATLLLCPLMGQLSAHAESTILRETEANVIGHVLNADTQEHLPAVAVHVVGTNFSTRTDHTGHYFFKDLPTGIYTLRFSALGYETLDRVVEVKANTSLTIDVSITPVSQRLGDIVISASRNATKRRLAPTMVNVMDAAIFEQTQSTDISQALKFQPGLRVENNCQNCGFSQVRINGLDGRYSQILIDSRPVFSALAGVYGLEQLPTNMVERIEVVRGGGSALYGASAVGGVINIITKEPTAPSAHFSHQINGLGGLSSFDNVTNFNATFVADNNRLGLTLFGHNKHRAGYDRDGDGFTEKPQLDGRSVGMQSFYKFSERSKLTAEFHASNEYRRGGDRLQERPHNAEVAEQLEHTNLNGSLNWTHFSVDGRHRWQLYTSFADVKRKSYYGGGDTASDLIATLSNPASSADESAAARKDLEGRLASYGRTNGLTTLTGGQYSYDFERLLFLPAQLTLGVEHSTDRLSDQSGYRNEDLSQNIHINSFFAQNEWRNAQWSILLGARIDKHSLLSRAVFSPRASLRFNPHPDLVLRANVSTGFRAPQVFDEDMHVENAGGDIYQIVNDAALHEERSQSYSLSADWYRQLGAWGVNLTAEAFMTRLEDAFATRAGGNVTINGIDVAQQIRFNSSGARVMGVNLEARLSYQKSFSLQAGWTLQRSRYDEAQLSGAEVIINDSPDGELTDTYATRRFLRTPDSYGYFVATYSPTKRLSFALNGSFTGSMLAAHNLITAEDGTLAVDDNGRPYSTVHTDRLMMGENQTATTYGGRTFKTPSFFEMGFKVQYDLPLYRYYQLQLFAGVNNIFDSFQDDLDRGRDRDSAYIYGPAAPRSFFAGVKMNF